MTKRNKPGAALPLLLLALSTFTAPALHPRPADAQTPPRNGRALQVAPEAKKAIDGLKSPFCPGEMLEVCPSSGGAMLRDSIERMAERGLKADSIISIVVAEYGEQLRASPRASGAGLWAWLLPPAVLLAGFVVVGVVLGNRRRAGEIPPVAPEDVDPVTAARLQAAIREVDRAEEPDF
jgi:cytochrome c-type biogenesis protein CcmH/NrfF